MSTADTADAADIADTADTADTAGIADTQHARPSATHSMPWSSATAQTIRTVWFGARRAPRYYAPHCLEHCERACVMHNIVRSMADTADTADTADIADTAGIVDTADTSDTADTGPQRSMAERMTERMNEV